MVPSLLIALSMRGFSALSFLSPSFSFFFVFDASTPLLLVRDSSINQRGSSLRGPGVSTTLFLKPFIPDKQIRESVALWRGAGHGRTQVRARTSFYQSPLLKRQYLESQSSCSEPVRTLTDPPGVGRGRSHLHDSV